MYSICLVIALTNDVNSASGLKRRFLLILSQSLDSTSVLKLSATEEHMSSTSNRKLDAVSKLKDVVLGSWSMAVAKRVRSRSTSTSRVYISGF